MVRWNQLSWVSPRHEDIMIDRERFENAYKSMVSGGPRHAGIEEMLEGLSQTEWLVSVRTLSTYLLIQYEAERRKTEPIDDGSDWILNKTFKLICDQTEADETLGDPESVFKRALIASKRMLEARHRRQCYRL